MDLSSLLQPVSIGIEVVLVILGIAIAVQKKRCYGWFIALTFGIYVIYDSLHYTGLVVSQNVLSGIFFIATLSILIGIWQLYRELYPPGSGNDQPGGE
jgi:cytochrome bd-type quinol oxidase subunit 2